MRLRPVPPRRQPGESWDRGLRAAYLPSLAGRVADPLGCGDALLATATCALAAGASPQAAAYLGSVAAAVAVGEVGNRPITAQQVGAHLAGRPQAVEAVARAA